MGKVHRETLLAGEYFLGVAGMAAMRRVLSRPSEGRPRIEEIRRIVGAFDQFPNDLSIELVEHDVESGYRAWAPVYDGPNPLIEVEQPLVRGMICDVPVGTAVDAGCGTGRHAGFLAERGFETIGVDATDGMLDVARRRFPDVDLRSGRLEALPVEDRSADLLTSALAVCHAPDLSAVFAEFARVVKPGGTVILSDPHPTTVQFGGVAAFRDPDHEGDGFTLSFVPNLLHPLHTYVNAAVAAGFEILECREPTMSAASLESNPAHAVLPEAVTQAFGGLPFPVVWRLRRTG